MIIWIASYPKSGNTYIRSLLSAYYFSKSGEFEFDLLKNIKQFPDNFFFDKELNNIEDAFKSYVPAQKNIFESKKANFLKTHNLLGFYKGYPFTIPEYTLGAIYVVRDPRNVILSLMNHYSLSEKEAFEFITDDNRDIHQDDYDFASYAYLSSWSKHYISWCNAKKYRKFLIKYEELQNNKYETFRDLIVFLNTLLNRTERVDKDKLIKAIETTEFNILKQKEEKEGFLESVKDKQGKKKIFFSKGFGNRWENLVSSDTINKIQNKFHDEMISLGYLKK